MEIQVRKATPNDYKGILDLDPENKIYFGTDYIPSKFQKYIRDPDRKFYVAISNGKIVGMKMETIVDKGNTVISMSERGHHALKGQRIMTVIDKSPVVHGNHSQDAVTHYVTVSPYPWVNIKGKKRGIWTAPTIILKMMVRTYAFNPGELGIEEQTTTDGVLTKILSDHESLEYLRCPEIQWKIFPNKRVICDAGGVVYRLLEENFPKIINSTTTITATLDARGQCMSMSFACGYEVFNGYLCAMRYYCYNRNDTADVIRHIRYHLPIAAKKVSRHPLLLRIYIPVEIAESDVTDACKDIRGFEGVLGPFVKMAVFEREKDDSKMAKL